MLAVGGDGDLPVGPLAGQVDAHTGHHLGAVLQAEGGEVEAAGRRDEEEKKKTEEEEEDMQERGDKHRGRRRTLR